MATKRVPRTAKGVVALANKLAARFYEGQGYRVPEGYRFDEAHHPQEAACWDMARTAFELILDIDINDHAAELEETEAAQTTK